MIVQGNHRAEVTDNLDPLKSGRVKIRIDSLKVKDVWAEPALPIGGNINKGAYVIPQIGDRVFVFFDGGNPSAPIYFATSPIKTDIPAAFVTIDQLISNRAAQTLKAITSGKVVWDEPIPPGSVEYPYDQGIKFPGGLLIEIDESGGETRYSMHHPSNSYEEFTNDQHIMRIAGDDYEMIMGDLFLYIGGNLRRSVFGDLSETIVGNIVSDVGGNITATTVGNETRTIGGNMLLQIAGAFGVVSSTLSMVTGGGSMTFDTSGLTLLVRAAINLVSLVSFTITAPVIRLNGAAVFVGAGANKPIHMFGLSFCPYTGSNVTGGSPRVLGA